MLTLIISLSVIAFYIINIVCSKISKVAIKGLDIGSREVHNPFNLSNHFDTLSTKIVKRIKKC